MKKYFPYALGLIAALILSIGVGFYVVKLQTGDNYTEQTISESAENLPPPTDEMTSEKIFPVAKQSGKLNALDLSLDALTIGDSEDKVYKVLGQPNTTRQGNQGRIHLKYGNIEVVLYQRKISALVSQTPAVSTPRGIHEGSTAEDVFKEYGNDYELSNYENNNLYEYFVTSVDGVPCRLRFAVRNSDGKVDYISMRFDK